MTPRCVVLDFDGTFTDVEAEGAPFIERFRAAVADLLGRSVDEDWARALDEIARDPDRHGWRFDGKIVAPANADPYIRSTTAAGLVLDAAGVLLDSEDRDPVIQSFYHLCYRHTGTAFRSDARQVLERLLAAGISTWVVTNSSTELVRRKIETLAPAGVERLQVIGDARKFVVVDPAGPRDPRFERVPALRKVPELPRPIYPRRGRYFEALRRIWEQTGAGPESTLVVGDIYELDLLLPAQLGCDVHLVSSPRSALWELVELDQLIPRAAHSPELPAILARLGS